VRAEGVGLIQHAAFRHAGIANDKSKLPANVSFAMCANQGANNCSVSGLANAGDYEREGGREHMIMYGDFPKNSRVSKRATLVGIDVVRANWRKPEQGTGGSNAHDHLWRFLKELARLVRPAL
jgi:hypothetical protein